MKKNVLFPLFAVILFNISCSQDPDLPASEPFVSGVFTVSEEMRHRVPVDSAISALNSVLASLDGGATRSGSVRSVKNISVVKAADVLPATRAAETPDVEDLVYIANLGNDEGYAILAADDRLEPVIAITEQGSLTPAEFKAVADGEYDLSQGDVPPMFPEVAAYAMRIGTIGGGTGGIGGGGIGGGGIGGGTGGGNFGWQGGLVDWQGNPDKPQDRVTIEGGWEPYDRMGPYIVTKWGQDKPFNFWIPKTDGQNNSKVGCVAVAVAQVLASNKYRFDRSSMVNNSRYSPPPTIYWGDIRKAIDNFVAREDKKYGFFRWAEYSGFETGNRSAEVSAVTQFLRVIADWLNMDYGTGGSETWNSNARDVLEDFGYQNAKYRFYEDGLVDMMISERRYPMLMSGTTSSNNGHMWIVDGRYRMRQQTQVVSKLDPTYVYYTTTSYWALYHCNFGWAGLCDGYYTIGTIFDTTVKPEKQEDEDLDKGDDVDGSLYAHWQRVITYTGW